MFSLKDQNSFYLVNIIGNILALTAAAHIVERGERRKYL